MTNDLTAPICQCATCAADHVGDLFDAVSTELDGEDAMDVVYVIGMLIAHACQDFEPDVNAMFTQLREVVAIELDATGPVTH